MGKDLKYKLVRAGKKAWNHDDFHKPSRFYQLLALKDIPRYGVKEGDLGGFVQDKHILSQSGDCWIGENALVYGHVEVKDDAYVGGTASLLNNFPSVKLIVSEEASVTGHAQLYIYRDENKSAPESGMHISDQAKISGEAVLANVGNVIGRANISGSAELKGCESISGDSDISGNAVLHAGVSILDTVISGKSIIKRRSILSHCLVKDAEIPSFTKASDTAFEGEVSKVNYPLSQEFSSEENAPAKLNTLESEESAPMIPELSDVMVAFNDIKDNIASYETDIVKLIKYPVMADRTDPFTRAMVKAVNIANRLSRKPESTAFEDAVSELEDAFLAAESNALKLAATEIPEQGIKKLQKAKDMLSIASNEASSEQEKKVSFHQAFKQLEGVIAVPEVAVDTFRVKIGLKELETL
jgi:carbonic anhydrase/acetyltransferase-like protein (isoleucine patch superfamily)